MKQVTIFLMMVMVGLVTGGAYGDINYEYYEGTWDNLPDFDALTPVDTGTDPNFDIGNRTQNEYFAFRFTGYISVPADGVYTFYTTSDDGSALYIGNTLVVDNDGLHSPQERSGSIYLTATAKHGITVTMFEKTGGETLEVRYAGPGIGKQRIPDGALSLSTAAASFPLPAHEAGGVDPTAVLSWQGPGGSPTYDVYLSTDPAFPGGAVSTGQSETSFDPCGVVELLTGVEYFWKIDVDGGTVPGNLWSFRIGFGQSLVAYYDMEDDANDASGHDLDGIFMGDAHTVFNAERGSRVLDLDGNGDYMETNLTALFLGINGNAPKTVAAWVYARSFNDGGIFDLGSGGGGQEFGLRTLNADRLWRGQFEGNWDLSFYQDSLNKWVHFTVVHDGTTTTIYENGNPHRRRSQTLNTVSGQTFRIGEWRSGRYYDGLIDNLAIWNYALSEEEIRGLIPWGDYDDDKDVDATDAETLERDWLTDNTVPGPLLDPNILEDYEPYLNTMVLDLLYLWWEPEVGSTADKTLLTGGYPISHSGDKAMRVEYVHAANTNWITLGRYLTNPDQPGKLDMAKYDELRFWIKRYAGNEDKVIFLFHFPNLAPGQPNPGHEAVQIGPISMVGDPCDFGEWVEVVIDLHGPDVQWSVDSGFPIYGGPEDVNNVNAFLFSILNISDEATTGVIDLDDIMLVDTIPDCAGAPVADVTGDCMTNVDDFAALGANFLLDISP